MGLNFLTVRESIGQGACMVSGHCQLCGRPVEFTVPLKGFREWTDEKKMVQDCLPSLTAGEREFLISRTCEECFDALYKE